MATRLVNQLWTGTFKILDLHILLASKALGIWFSPANPSLIYSSIYLVGLAQRTYREVFYPAVVPQPHVNKHVI